MDTFPTLPYNASKQGVLLRLCGCKTLAILLQSKTTGGFYQGRFEKHTPYLAEAGARNSIGIDRRVDVDRPRTASEDE